MVVSSCRNDPDSLQQRQEENKRLFLRIQFLLWGTDDRHRRRGPYWIVVASMFSPTDYVFFRLLETASLKGYTPMQGVAHPTSTQ